MTEPFDFPSYEHFRAEKIALGNRHSIAMRAVDDAELDRRCDIEKQMMLMTLRAYVLAMPKERITVHRQWPADWWEAIKERFAPRWFLNHWPVRYERIDIDQQIYAGVCPHLQADDKRQHLEWMSGSHRQPQEKP